MMLRFPPFHAFVGTFMLFLGQKCQNVAFLFRGKVHYSTFSNTLTIFSTVLHGSLGKMNNL